ncbi:CHAP domain-containing protein [Candidatus Poribacteria bacterium]|nr:CHAP domain-containing protein [Candidatus Poribacteria bacterium]
MGRLYATREIEKILSENGYQSQGKRGNEKAKVDDITVYRTQGETEIRHTGIVIAVDENGKVVKVQSKWGDKGEYRHHPDDSPYGENWEVYRRIAGEEDE